MQKKRRKHRISGWITMLLKKEEGGKKVRNVTGFITVIMYGRENV